eukprot:scaffold89702_cov66-Phaeocystis_antarctica.AAC.2
MRRAPSKRQGSPGRCFSRSSSISDGSLAQPKQARLSAAGAGGPPLSAAAASAGAAVAAAAAAAAAVALASLSAFSAAERHANLLGACSQVWLLLPQLGEQRLEAEVGLRNLQYAHGLEEGIGRAGLAHAGAPGQGQPGPAAPAQQRRPSSPVAYVSTRRLVCRQTDRQRFGRKEARTSA